MNNRHECIPERIGRFLNSELSEPEQAELESHLDTCETCRAKLTDSTASLDFWESAQEFLRDDAFDLDSMFAPKTEHFDDSNSVDKDNRSTEVGHILRLLQPTDDPHMLGRIGSYEIAAVIGTGGMGIVLKAFDAALNRFVAIKVLAPHLASSGAARQRFAREAQAAASVVHEHVVAIHGVSEFNGLPYLVMPFVRGTSLQKRIDQGGHLSLTEILRISVQAAAGLAAAHAQGLVHRDIKPANLLLEEGVERVAVTDFGLARAADDASLTRTGVIAGTPQYMSPEQARGDSVDHRSDLFSLGSVMYAMATGYPPFRAESSYAVLRRITDSEPKPIRQANPEIPEWLAWIIAKLQSKKPSDRFQSAAEVTNLLSQCLAHVQQPTQCDLPASLQMRVGSTGWKGWSNILLGGAAAIAFVFLLYLVVDFSRGEKHQVNSGADVASEKSHASESSGVTDQVPDDSTQESDRASTSDADFLDPTERNNRTSDLAEYNEAETSTSDWPDGTVEQEIEELSDLLNHLEREVEIDWP